MKDFFNCKQCVDLLFDYLEGNLGSDTETRLDNHLATCAPCINFVNTYKKSSTMIQQLRDHEADVPIEVQSRLKSFLHDQITSLEEKEGAR